MFTPKYNYHVVIQDLVDHKVDIDKFKKKVEQMCGGTIRQDMFEFIYECLVVNNYNIDLMI